MEEVTTTLNKVYVECPKCSAPIVIEVRVSAKKMQVNVENEAVVKCPMCNTPIAIEVNAKKIEVHEENKEESRVMIDTLSELVGETDQDQWIAIKDIAENYRIRRGLEVFSSNKASNILKMLGFTERDRKMHGSFIHVFIKAETLKRLKSLYKDTSITSEV